MSEVFNKTILEMCTSIANAMSGIYSNIDTDSIGSGEIATTSQDLTYTELTDVFNSRTGGRDRNTPSIYRTETKEDKSVTITATFSQDKNTDIEIISKTELATLYANVMANLKRSSNSTITAKDLYMLLEIVFIHIVNYSTITNYKDTNYYVLTLPSASFISVLLASYKNDSDRNKNTIEEGITLNNFNAIVTGITSYTLSNPLPPITSHSVSSSSSSSSCSSSSCSSSSCSSSSCSSSCSSSSCSSSCSSSSSSSSSLFIGYFSIC